MIKIKSIKSFFIIPLLSLALFSCSANKTDHTVYRTTFESDVPSLDPINVGDTQSHDVAYNLYNGLVTYRPTITGPGQKLTDLVPDLAESWIVSDGGKTYTFKLKKGIKFHNGREFEASDVKYCIQRLANPRNSSKGFWTLNVLPLKGMKEYVKECKAGNKNAELEGVKVLDKYTVRISLSKLVPFALHVMAMAYYYIAPREEIEKWGKDYSMHPVGTGPYKFKEWVRGIRLALVKNPDYFEKGLPHIDELRYLIVPSEDSRFMRFEKGEEDHHAPIPSARFDKMLNDPLWNKIGAEELRKLDNLNDPEKSHIIKAPLLTSTYFGMDVKAWPFTDKRVRQAFNYGIDKQKVIDRVLNGRGVVATGVLPKGFPGYDSTRAVPYPYNPIKAKQLLKEAGFTDTNNDGVLDQNGRPMDFTFWHNQGGIRSSMASSVQADLNEIGIKVEIRSMQWAPYVDKIRRNEAIFFVMAWSADYPDPDNFLWTLLSGDNIGQDNHSNYSNPVVNELLASAQNIGDWNKREKLYREAENIIVDDAPWVFMYNPVDYKIVQPRIVNQQIHPLIQNVMKIVEIKK